MAAAPFQKNIQIIDIKTVADYKGTKGEIELDIRPTNFEFETKSLDLCGAHGTNLSSVISSIINCNSQIVPGLKLRKLGIIPSAGESGGTTSLNRKFVSCTGLGSRQVNGAVNYSKASTANPQSVSDIIPAVVFGDGAVRESRGIGSKKPDALYPKSDILGEIAFKRLNIRIIAVPDENVDLAKAALAELKVKDIRVCSFSKLREFSRDDQIIDMKGLWRASENSLIPSASPSGASSTALVEAGAVKGGSR